MGTQTSLSRAVVDHGGTITHHHAVGCDHLSGYELEVDPLFRRILAAAKQVADPRAILNPGVLFDSVDRPIGRTGRLLELRPYSKLAGAIIGENAELSGR
jgi:hypothetical protein